MTNPRIKKAGDLGLDYMKVVAYGAPGTGKTTMGATFPDVLFLSAESGLLSVRDRDIDVWEIKGWEDIQEAFAFLLSPNHGYKSVVIDSLTEVQKKLFEYIVKTFAKRREYEDLMTLQDWGKAGDSLRKLCRSFRDLPMNVVFLALQEEAAVDGDALVRPLLKGKGISGRTRGLGRHVCLLPGPHQG